MMLTIQHVSRSALRRPGVPTTRGFLFLMLLSLFLPAGNRVDAETEIINFQSYFTTYVVFAPNELDGEKLQDYLDSRDDRGNPVLSERALDRFEAEIEENLRRHGYHPEDMDWRERPIIAWGEDRNALPLVEPPPPPGDWMMPDFDEQGWVTRPAPLLLAQGSRHSLTDRWLPVPRRVRAAYFRTYFQGDASETYRLSLDYVGGIRVFVNGRELARAHLPEGEIDERTRAEGYDSPSHRERSLGDIEIPADLIRDGRNVLAVEIRAPGIHPAAGPRARERGRGNSWEFIIDPPTRINTLSLTSSAANAKPTFERPSGAHAWVVDPNARMYDIDFFPPASPNRKMRIFGTRNGAFSGMISVGGDRALSGLRAEVESLSRRDGAAAAGRQVGPEIRLRAMAHKTFDEMHTTGGHRGSSNWGLGSHFSERIERGTEPSTDLVLDEITHNNRIAELPADATGGFWVDVWIPEDTPPGVYEGMIRVSAEEGLEQNIPMEIHVADWRLPAPAEWETDIWLEVSPFSLAEKTGVVLWSEEHFDLLEQTFAHVGRIGGDTVIIPVLQHSEFGNAEESLVRWDTNNERIDVSTLDRYLLRALRGMGYRPQAVIFAVMQGHMGVDTIQTANRDGAVELTDDQWRSFARQLYAYMESRNLADSMVWGLPWDLMPTRKRHQLALLKEEDAAPRVRWARASHAYGFDDDFRFVSVVYFGMDDAYRNLKRKAGAGDTTMGDEEFGWQKDGMFVSNPRLHNTVQQIMGYYPAFAFRIFPTRAMGLGYTGIGRMGANYWGTWAGGEVTAPPWEDEDGRIRPNAELVDFSIKDLLWLDVDNRRIHSSQRFEMLREGVQEAEARIFLEKHLASSSLDAEFRSRIEQVLEQHLYEVSFITRRTNSHLANDHSQRWQERSWMLFQTAAEAANTPR